MSDEAALLAAICANPDEDTPRLAYADWLQENGDPHRAEYVRNQIELASLPDPVPDAATYLRRGELNAQLGWKHPWEDRWAAGLGLGERAASSGHVTFRRGFPDAVRPGVDWLLKDDGRVFDAAPIRTADAGLLPQDALDRLLARPWLSRLRALSLQGRTPLDFSALPATPFLANLESLAVHRGVLTTTAADRIAHSPHLANLRRLILYQVPLSDAAAAALAGGPALGRLSELALDNTGMTAAGWEALAASPHMENVSHLTLYEALDPAAARVLGRARFWPRLRKLSLYKQAGGEGMTDHALMELVTAPDPPALEALDLCGNQLTAVGFTLLAQSPILRDVVYLRVDSNRSDGDGLAALARSRYVGKLGEALIDNNPFGPEGAKALAASDRLTNLFALSASGCDFDTAGFRAIAESSLAERLHSFYVGGGVRKPVQELLQRRFGFRVRL